MLLSNRVYDILKWCVMYFLPGLSALYLAVSSIWGLPYGKEVVGTLAAITAFIATLLGLSASTYNKMDHSDGTLEIDTENWDVDKYKLSLTTGLDDIQCKKEILLKVDPNASLSQDKHGL